MLKSRAATWGLLLLIALAAGLAAYYTSRELLPPEPPTLPQVRPATIPDQRPDLTLADRDGKPRALSEWNGEAHMINFWATWCAPCRREIPMLNALAREWEPRGLRLIGIAIDFRADVLKYLETTPIDYTVLIGEQDGLEAARAFGMATIGLPFTAFIDRQGRIVTIHVGELHRPQAEVILWAVEAVDSGQIDLAAARDRIRVELARMEPPGSP